MVNYQLPKFKLPKLKAPKIKSSGLRKTKLSQILILVILISSFSGFLAGIVSGTYFYQEMVNLLNKLNTEINNIKIVPQNNYLPQVSQEQIIVEVVEKVSPAVVSIIITKDQPVFEKRQVGGGTGFIISEDGMVLTNKHVVLDETAEYTVLTLDNKKFPAEVLARDPIQDIAILRIGQEESAPEEIKPFPKINLGDSDEIKIGQTAIAIGYVLGKYQNAVSVGVVSGLGRTIIASGGGFYETLEDIIQTDAAINMGNSGGPLLNLKGEVIGINTAIDIEGQNIGFAIPINKAKRDIEQVKALGKIVYPFLGVRYILINEDVQRENNLGVDYGAWVVSYQGKPAIFPDSAAEKAGLKERDIILEFNGEKITMENSLAKIIINYNPGDKVSLKILRDNTEKLINATLGEM
ncbi:MAG: trypsin-like peptidase domain-containing protein [Candidatus Nealsonbacteria bacterium]|nr:MAG: trypsin-like peptidase domain-containing protein [Candidatus Nealsonbacteria bacterium]